MNKDNSRQNQRWYDKDPTVSLAVSFIRNASVEHQNEIADRIMGKTRELGVKVNEIRVLLQRRWFDENEKLSLAMEHLRQASEAQKKIIAIDIINFLTEIKA